MSAKLSIAELVDWQDKYDLGLPSTDRGIAGKVHREGWAYEEVAGKGGPGGIKKVYTLPAYIVERLEEKGLLGLIDEPRLPETETVPADNTNKEQLARQHRELSKIPDSSMQDVPYMMRPMVEGYDDWAGEQSPQKIVPVRYHVNVFGSAGSGYELFEDAATEAMWFRASFFDYLETSPQKCFCTRVKGDSMHPTLIDRGTVLWQMATRYTAEGIYLFRQFNELRIKRLQMAGRHTIRIISDSAEKDIYPTTLLDLSELQEHEFEIYGRYLWNCGIAR